MRTFSAKLVLDRDRGVMGTEEEYYCEGEDQRLVEVIISVPDSFFDPIKLTVDVPEEFLVSQPIAGNVESVEIPVMVAGKRGDIKIVEEVVEPHRCTNILALLKRAIFRA